LIRLQTVKPNALLGVIGLTAALDRTKALGD